MNIGVVIIILVAAIALLSISSQYIGKHQKISASKPAMISGKQHTPRRQKTPMPSAKQLAEFNRNLTDPEAIREQLQKGNKINAIKLHREQTGLGLRESKAAVEMMAAEMPGGRISSQLEGEHRLDTARNYQWTGEKIQAIKAYRQQTGAGLKEAKEAVERMWAEQPGSMTDAPAVQQSTLDTDELHRLIRAKQKIQAIKYYRETTGAGLKEAKEAVEWLEIQMGQEN